MSRISHLEVFIAVKAAKMMGKYYHLRQSEDGRFSQSSTIALISVDTTKEERDALADAFTNGQYSQYSGFYSIDGPFASLPILKLR
jgi:hypothetical protein